MSFLPTRSVIYPALSALSNGTRPITTSARLNNLMGKNPRANQPDSNATQVRKDTPNTDPQSSASKVEHLTGDDHPAKQPDPQEKPTRSTGIESQDEVKGGKQKGWDPEKERKRGEGIATD
ncbi:hypothetical protein GQ43DRAFT_387617 [Delitschia confertaspora ATCC 74209]|uniref:Uncharacterized protein n=1 Tax=Delitschia confertaspora ATCC 74209 TaxID=1513339 RepID=A0A9P4N291_9PLEO|nr:hypothetical protein GQ43DRAFT_387617 [Delitschia confertaspora ATCC 74209]